MLEDPQSLLLVSIGAKIADRHLSVQRLNPLLPRFPLAVFVARRSRKSSRCDCCCALLCRSRSTAALSKTDRPTDQPLPTPARAARPLRRGVSRQTLWLSFILSIGRSTAAPRHAAPHVYPKSLMDGSILSTGP